MRKARAFFLVCAGIFLLALAYHLGARSAGAQAPGNPVVGVTAIPAGASWELVAVTANGDAYRNTSANGFLAWTPIAGVFGGGPTPATSRPSWGQVKARYASPAPTKVTR